MMSTVDLGARALSAVDQMKECLHELASGLDAANRAAAAHAKDADLWRSEAADAGQRAEKAERARDAAELRANASDLQRETARNDVVAASAFLEAALRGEEQAFEPETRLQEAALKLAAELRRENERNAALNAALHSTAMERGRLEAILVAANEGREPPPRSDDDGALEQELRRLHEHHRERRDKLARLRDAYRALSAARAVRIEGHPEDLDVELRVIGELAAEGIAEHLASFSVKPLMGPANRLDLALRTALDEACATWRKCSAWERQWAIESLCKQVESAERSGGETGFLAAVRALSAIAHDQAVRDAIAGGEAA